MLSRTIPALGKGQNNDVFYPMPPDKIQAGENDVRSIQHMDRIYHPETVCCIRGVSVLIKLFSSSSASASERVTVVSIPAI